MSTSTSVDNTTIERVKETTFLGVIMDEKVSWQNHIDQLEQKLAKNI